MKKILFVSAHPDDETFLPGATLAKYAAMDVTIHVISATRGESGQWANVKPNNRTLGEVREEEHRKAAKILGIQSISYLDYIDGKIANNDIVEIEKKVLAITQTFNPDILITIDLMGISGHVDHIAMSIVATSVYEQHTAIKKLYYYAIPQSLVDANKSQDTRKVWGRPDVELQTRVDVSSFVQIKLEAANCHQTQLHDVKRLSPLWKTRTVDYFYLGGCRVKSKLPESDLFAGIK